MSLVSKDHFIQILDGLKQADTASKNLDIMRDSDVYQSSYDFFDSYCLRNANKDTIIFLLETMFDDEDKWIEYYCHDLNYGTKWEPGKVTNLYGDDVPLSTASELYDLLLNSQRINYLMHENTKKRALRGENITSNQATYWLTAYVYSDGEEDDKITYYKKH